MICDICKKDRYSAESHLRFYNGSDYFSVCPACAEHSAKDYKIAVDLEKEQLEEIKSKDCTRFFSLGITVIPSFEVDKDTIKCNGIEFKLSNLEEK